MGPFCHCVGRTALLVGTPKVNVKGNLLPNYKKSSELIHFILRRPLFTFYKDDRKMKKLAKRVGKGWTKMIEEMKKSAKGWAISLSPPMGPPLGLVTSSKTQIRDCQ